MKKLAILLFILVFSSYSAIQAQRLIAVDHSGTVTTFTRLDTALVHAVNGDNVYLPGGSFNISGGLSITKKLYIYGAGHYPDSTTATGQTYITGGTLFIKSGADSGSLCGIYAGVSS